MPILELEATATITPARTCTIVARDPDLHRLIAATVAAFTDALGPPPPVAISVTTEIPRSVGLAGSSAIVIAVLRVLADAIDHVWNEIELAELALDVEAVRLGIAAGLQDRLVQAAGRPVLMRFAPVSFVPVALAADLPLFVAWDPMAAEPSGAVHRPLRQRFEAGESRVVDAMSELADLAITAGAAITAGRYDAVGRAMDRSFDLRASIVDVGARQRRLVDSGRRLGAAVNSAGSGGSVVGLAADPISLPALAAAYRTIGAEFRRCGVTSGVRHPG
jgi:glucuronokinase